MKMIEYKIAQLFSGRAYWELWRIEEVLNKNFFSKSKGMWLTKPDANSFNGVGYALFISELEDMDAVSIHVNRPEEYSFSNVCVNLKKIQ